MSSIVFTQARMFLLITNAAMLVITGSSAFVSLVCLDLFVIFAELPNILVTLTALCSPDFSFCHSTAPAPPVRYSLALALAYFRRLPIQVNGGHLSRTSPCMTDSV